MSKKVTSRDVAKAAGVSQSLVSLILNNVTDKKIKQETREHVIEVARQLNYTININAKNMKSRRAGAIGLLSTWDTGSFVFPPIIKGVQDICSENDLGVIICSGKESISGYKDYINYYYQNRIDGLIYISYVGVKEEGVISELKHHNIPFVCVIGARDISDVSCVDVSFFQSGYLAGKHLLEEKYTSIGYILPGKLENLNYAEQERMEGCKKGTLEGGGSFRLVDSFIGLSGDDEVDRAANAIINSKEYDALVSTSFGCFKLSKAAARIGKKIPEELGVISLDNDVFAPFLYPSLTTIDEPLADMAKTAVEILLNNMNGEAKVIKKELAPQLSIRESTSR